MKQYSEMLEEAKNAGLTNEKIMWKSIAGVSEMLQLVKRDHPEMYWEFMREQHGILMETITMNRSPYMMCP